MPATGVMEYTKMILFKEVGEDNFTTASEGIVKSVLLHISRNNVICHNYFRKIFDYLYAKSLRNVGTKGNSIKIIICIFIIVSFIM